MSQLKDSQRQLLIELSRRMPQYGFEGKPVGQSFHKATSYGKDALHLSFIRHENDFDVTADVAIRIDAIEDLVNAESKLLSKAEKRHTFTLGVELGNWAEGAQHRWTVAGPEDVPVVAGSVLSMFERVGIPYLERYSSLDGAYDALARNDNDQGSWLHSPVHASRCMRATAASYLLGKDDMDRLVKDCESFLRERKDVGLVSFQQFVNFLRQLSRRGIREA